MGFLGTLTLELILYTAVSMMSPHINTSMLLHHTLSLLYSHCYTTYHWYHIDH